METTPIRTYKSRVEGRNADVTFYDDRVEWSVTKIGRKRASSTEMMPIKHVSSVTSKKDGLLYTIVVLVASGNTVEFRLRHDEAKDAQDVLKRLLLGERPAPQVVHVTTAPAPAPAAQPASTPPPPAPALPSAPPPPPAGWRPDPTGRHQLRYWDGTSWSEHVSDQGAQGTDPM